jgi:6-phosphofructokinase 2
MTARIVTLTTNPALDVGCLAQSVVPTHKIRTTAQRLDAGGGGINVSKVIHSLGGETLAIVMTGGSTGRICEDLLNEAGVPWQALPIREKTRICLNVQERATGLEYRFVADGPCLGEDEWESALDALRIVDCAWIVASGSLARGIPPDFYAKVAAIAEARGLDFALDTSGQPLKAAMESRISLLKLSLGELEFLVGTSLQEKQSQDAAVNQLLSTKRIGWIAVSLGANGALLATRDSLVRLPAIPIDAQGAAGAGDSFLAAMILALTRGLQPREALGFGIAAGSAAVGSYGTAQVLRQTVESLYSSNFGT